MFDVSARRSTHAQGRKKPEAIKDGFFAQFYNGINLEKRFVNGYYMAFQIMKRGLLAACCIFLGEVNFYVRLSIFCSINFLGTIPFFALRPYKELIMNLMEGLHEIQFFLITIVILTTGGTNFGW